MIPHSADWSFDDLALYAYCVVDDCLSRCRAYHPEWQRPGPAPECSNSELITMLLLGECMGWDDESELVRQMAAHHDLFPIQPSRSRLNRRRKQLAGVTNVLRQALLPLIDMAYDRQCLIDSLPVPVVQFHLVPSTLAREAGVHWVEHGAAFGKVASRKQTLFGYKLQLLVAVNGVVLDFLLAPANTMDLDAGYELLSGHTALIVIGDKGYVSAPLADDLWQHNRIRLISEQRRNQHQQLSKGLTTLIKHFRQRIESVNAQLNHQFHIETNYAHTFGGLAARIYTKLTAHTLCIYINQLIGNDAPLHIQRLAAA
jgi:Transposase DDE domain